MLDFCAELCRRGLGFSNLRLPCVRSEVSDGRDEGLSLHANENKARTESRERGSSERERERNILPHAKLSSVPFPQIFGSAPHKFSVLVLQQPQRTPFDSPTSSRLSLRTVGNVSCGLARPRRQLENSGDLAFAEEISLNPRASTSTSLSLSAPFSIPTPPSSRLFIGSPVCPSTHRMVRRVKREAKGNRTRK